ncbi:MAG: hypothetical protein ACO3GN_02155 [Bacteroidia bacterium]|jgi:hypothetical protein
MTFSDFIAQYDIEGSVVLLEGKREVREQDAPLLTKLGRLLASQTQHMSFRSGNAPGADEFFSMGVTEVDPKRLQLVTPYGGHRRTANHAHQTYALDEIDLASEPDLVYQSKTGGRNDKLIDRFAEGHRDRASIKAAYLVRDTVKVIGTRAIAPASFGIFYDNLEDPRTGGTGHTMAVCTNNQVPFIDQSVWMLWLGTHPNGI